MYWKQYIQGLLWIFNTFCSIGFQSGRSNWIACLLQFTGNLESKQWRRQLDIYFLKKTLPHSRPIQSSLWRTVGLPCHVTRSHPVLRDSSYLIMFNHTSSLGCIVSRYLSSEETYVNFSHLFSLCCHLEYVVMQTVSSARGHHTQI